MSNTPYYGVPQQPYRPVTPYMAYPRMYLPQGSFRWVPPARLSGGVQAQLAVQILIVAAILIESFIALILSAQQGGEVIGATLLGRFMLYSSLFTMATISVFLILKTNRVAYLMGWITILLNMGSVLILGCFRILVAMLGNDPGSSMHHLLTTPNPLTMLGAWLWFFTGIKLWSDNSEDYRQWGTTLGEAVNTYMPAAWLYGVLIVLLFISAIVLMLPSTREYYRKRYYPN